MNIFLKIAILIFFSNTLYAKSIINQYIFSSTVNDATIQETKQLFDKNKYKKNYLDKVRLSADYSEFSDLESEYSIRLYPKSISKVELEESNYDIRKKQVQNQLLNKKIKGLKSKYSTVLEAFYQRKILKNIENLKQAYKAGIKSSQNQIEDSIDIQKLSKLKDKLKQLDLLYIQKAYKYKSRLKNIQDEVTNSTLKDINSELENFTVLSSNKIIDLISKDNYAKNNETDKKYIYENELLQNKYRLKKIKKNIMLESIEVKYDDSKKTNKNLSIGINIEVPVGEEDSINTKLKQITLHNKMIQKELDDKSEISQLIQDIKFLYKYKDEIQQYNIEKQNFYNQYTKLEKTDPNFILDLKKRTLEYEKDMIKTEYRLHQKYLELLYLTNLLSIDATNQLFNKNGS